MSNSNIVRHEKSCYLNPDNIRMCAVCGKPIKDYKNSKGTCSHSCANTMFRSGINHGNWKEDNYTTTCFYYHKRECVVCGEKFIVEVHHFDENHSNNEPSNLIPMCPTHHQYWHSGYKYLIEDIVIEYRNKYIKVLSRSSSGKDMRLSIS